MSHTCLNNGTTNINPGVLFFLVTRDIFLTVRVCLLLLSSKNSSCLSVTLIFLPPLFKLLIWNKYSGLFFLISYIANMVTQKVFKPLGYHNSQTTSKKI